MKSSKFARTGIVALSVAALALAGCSNSEAGSDKKVDTAASVAAPTKQAQDSAASSTAATATQDADAVTLVDGFVKAKPADKSMTAIFGELSNPTSTAKRLVGFTTSLGEAKYEIHEVVDGTMREKADGIAIPAGGTYTLKPGGDHLMIMGYDQPIAAGDTVNVTLKFDDGTTATVANLPVRTIASGQENYNGNGGVEGSTGMSEAPAHNHN